MAKILIYHNRKLSYIYLQRRATSDEAVQTTCSFEKYARCHIIQIKSYHYDNGILSDNAIVQ